MKASMKLRVEEGRPPLLRAKLPFSAFGLPLVVAAAAAAVGDDPKDLYFHLRTILSTGPSLKLSYHPNLSSHPFSLSLTSGISPLGSPTCSPLLFSAHVSLSPSGPSPISFSIRFAPQFGDFTLRKTAVYSTSPNPNYNTKENGGGIHRPIPFARSNELASVISPGLELSARTTITVHQRAAVRFRWAVNFPPVESSPAGPPYLTLNKISVEPVEAGDRKETREAAEWGEKGDAEALKGMCSSIRTEVEELQRVNRMIGESVGVVKREAFDGRGNGSAAPGRIRRLVCGKYAAGAIRASTGAAINRAL